MERIFVHYSDSTIKEHKQINNKSILILSRKDFETEVYNNNISLRRKIIFFYNCYDLFVKLKNDNKLQLDIRGMDFGKLNKLPYCTSVLDHSRFIITTSAIEKELYDAKINIFLSKELEDWDDLDISYDILSKQDFIDRFDEIYNMEGDIGFDYETHGLNPLDISSGFEIIGVGICNGIQNYYIEFRNNNTCDEDLFKTLMLKFVKDHCHRLWTYYVPFEQIVTYAYLGEFIEFQDSRVLCMCDENGGTLKYTSQFYLGVGDWESLTLDIKSKIVNEITKGVSFVPEDHGYDRGEYERYKSKFEFNKGSPISYLPTKVISKYCVQDCICTIRLKEKLYDKYKMAYECYIKNFYLYTLLRNAGMVFEDKELELVNNKYTIIMHNLSLIINRFYYAYKIYEVKFDLDEFLSPALLELFNSYGSQSYQEMAKNILLDIVNPEMIGYLDYTNISNNIKDSKLRTDIMQLMEAWRNHGVLLNKINLRSKVVTQLATILARHFNLDEITRQIMKTTIINSKSQFYKVLENYFEYKIIVHYNLGTYDRKLRSHVLFNKTEYHEFLLVIKAEDPESLSELTKEQRDKYLSVLYKINDPDFKKNIDQVHVNVKEFYESYIVPLFNETYSLVEIFNKLLSDRILDEEMFCRCIGKSYKLINLRELQFSLSDIGITKSYMRKLEELSFISDVSILNGKLNQSIEFDLNINAKKTEIYNMIKKFYSKLYYNFCKIFNQTFVGLEKFNSYQDVVKFLETDHGEDDTVVDVLVNNKFFINPHLRLLRFEFSDGPSDENMDTSYNFDPFDFESFSKLCKAFLLYNKLFKLKSTYINGALMTKDKYHLHHVDNKGFSYIDQSSDKKVIIPEFKVLGVKTKRWSSGMHTFNKNMEPARYLKMVDNHIGVYFDLSAAEVRSAAYMSGDPLMIKVFNDGKDIYQYMRDMITDKISRNGYKTVVLGLIYGRSDAAIVRQIHQIPPAEVVKALKDFKATFHVLWDYISSQTKYCMDHKKIRTFLGDRIDVSDYSENKLATVGMNYSVQGATATLVAEGGYNVYKENYDKCRYLRMINTVHDSISFSLHAKDFFDVYNTLEESFNGYLQKKYGIKYKFELELYIDMRNKTKISSPSEGCYNLDGDQAIEIFELLSKFHKLKEVHREITNVGVHIFNENKNQNIYAISQDLFTLNNHIITNKSKMEFTHENNI